MSNAIAAKRYANALFQLARDNDQLDRLEDEVRTLKEVFSINYELPSFLEHPKVPLEKKQEMIQSTFADFSPAVRNLLVLLVERHREDIVTDMADEFLMLVNEHTGIVDAKVYSVRPLTDQEQDVISKVFAHKIGKKALRIENIVDSNLLGGIKLHIGNRIFDGSVSGKLERLERRLLG